MPNCGSGPGLAEAPPDPVGSDHRLCHARSDGGVVAQRPDCCIGWRKDHADGTRRRSTEILPRHSSPTSSVAAISSMQLYQRRDGWLSSAWPMDRPFESCAGPEVKVAHRLQLRSDQKPCVLRPVARPGCPNQPTERRIVERGILGPRYSYAVAIATPARQIRKPSTRWRTMTR